MPAPAIIHAALMRPIVLDSPTGEQAAGFEIVAKNGDQFLVPLSGEGMKGLIEDTRLLLEEPHTSREFACGTTVIVITEEPAFLVQTNFHGP